MLSIREYFNKLRQEHADRKRTKQSFEAVRVAITSQNMQDLEPHLGASYSYGQAQSLVRAALLSDHADLFNKVLQRVWDDNPNKKLREHWGVPGGGIYSDKTMSLLYTAIVFGKPQVALSLARNPKTDIHFSGHTSTSRYYSGGLLHSGHVEEKTTYYDTCLVAARKEGMDDVVKVLAEREAAHLQQKAAALKQEAGLAP